MFTEKEGGEGFWSPQEVRVSENSTEGGNIQSISISPSGFENLTTPLSRQCSQKKMRTELGRRSVRTGGGVRES